MNYHANFWFRTLDSVYRPADAANLRHMVDNTPLHVDVERFRVDLPGAVRPNQAVAGIIADIRCVISTISARKRAS
jgi:hypothetical protein